MIFLAIFGCKTVNCDEMDGDRPRLPANRNCCRLSRVSWALAQISCFFYEKVLCINSLLILTFTLGEGCFLALRGYGCTWMSLRCPVFLHVLS